jgi:hypothetical protein
MDGWMNDYIIKFLDGWMGNYIIKFGGMDEN